MRANSSTWQAVGSGPEGWLIADWKLAQRSPSAATSGSRRSRHVAVLVAESDDAILGGSPLPAMRTRRALMSRMSASWSPGRAAARYRTCAHGCSRGGPARQASPRSRLHAFPHNAAAIALYEHLGYHREGYRRRLFRRGGETVDVVVMAKLIE